MCRRSETLEKKTNVSTNLLSNEKHTFLQAEELVSSTVQPGFSPNPQPLHVSEKSSQFSPLQFPAEELWNGNME